MNILIASDKFKGSVSAIDVCTAIQKGMSTTYPQAVYQLHPMADGGDGSLLILEQYLETERHYVDTIDPLGREISASYLTSDYTAYIEVAQSSGITLLSEHEKNPMVTSTHGTGVLIKHAMARNIKNVVILLGGSCTNDAGLGIAQSLGFKFLDASNNELNPTGGNLTEIQKIVANDNFEGIRFNILSDVTNPFYGPSGAAHVYARQKGADNDMIKHLDRGLRHIAAIIEKQYHVDIQSIAGSGSAGGIAGGLHALFNADILNGFDHLAKISLLHDKIAKADLVISGEGRLDTQSLDGKVIGKMSELCKQYDKAFVTVVGKNELTQIQLKKYGIQQVCSVMDLADSLEDGITNGRKYIEELSSQIAFIT